MAYQQMRRISLTGIKYVYCPRCYCRVKRRKQFWQCIGPHNKNRFNHTKSEKEIQAEIEAAHSIWIKKNEPCRKCLKSVTL